MLRFIMAAALAACVVAFSATAAPAAPPTLCIKAYPIRVKVIHKHGARAPGRNICRQGVIHSDGSTTKATTAQKARYIRAMRALVRSEPYLSITAGPPALLPAGTMSARAAPTGVAACIVAQESHGDPGAINGQYSGIAQWSAEAWSRMGGQRFASSPLGATYAQQLEVLNDGLARFGCADFCPFDGC